MTTTPSATAPRREIRSFVLRQGRMTGGQRHALDALWPRYGLEPHGPLDLDRLFGRRAPTVLEIGFGMGDHLLARAMAEPEKNFLGAEVHRPGVGRLLHGAAAARLTNLRVACVDAVTLLRESIAERALAQIVIQFPDPWHKTRHHKRRLVQPGFVQLAASRLVAGGSLQLATDWADYARHMLAVLNAEPILRNASADGGFVPRPAARLKTKFELRGERLGHEVFDLEYFRQ
ncbi:MAG TPA: tRNA (guanosine(46)-N7)-methyltransferase TrmB [Solimonas sp.]|nr:tRNA (guanosine(46)-N7)-methyltransferase TrmB [Solimonas sp.]